MGSLNNKTKFTVITVWLISLALLFVSCDYLSSSPTAAPDQTADVEVTAMPTPAETAAPEPAETPSETDAPVANETVNMRDYLAGGNIKVTMDRNLGDGSISTIAYVYAAREVEDSSYIITQFNELQPIFFTDFFIDDDGVWSKFSDSGSDNIQFVMPVELYEGMELILSGDEAYVLEIGATFEHGGYVAEDCVIIVAASVSYSQDVHHVYQKGVGEIARYISYGNDVIDIISAVKTVEEISQAEAEAIISDSTF